MDKNKLKKIMAREVFAIIGVILLSCLTFFISSVYPPFNRAPVEILGSDLET